jgi:nodulation protein A
VIDFAVFAETQFTPELERETRALLVQAFPAHAAFFAEHSYRGSVPEWRLVGRDTATGHLLTHLACGPREIAVGTQAVHILGIGAVAVHPAQQGRGLGRQMFEALGQAARQRRLAGFGFLECREAVAGFYQRAGFERMHQASSSEHHATRQRQTWRGPVMVMPLLQPLDAWPREGDIDLLGMDW